MNVRINDLFPIIDKIKLIDIRSVEKYNDNHIPGAKNVNFEQLLIHPEKYLNRYDTYYIYCQKGLSSGKVVRILSQQGYRVINIIGGYESWLLEKP